MFNPLPHARMNWVVFLLIIAFAMPAQAESLTMTSYYPSPAGDYLNLKVSSVLSVDRFSTSDPYAYIQNLAPWGLNARTQGLIIIPEGTVTDDGAGALTFGSTVIIMNPLSGSWVRVAAGTYNLGSWGSLWASIPPTATRGNTVTPTVLAFSDEDRVYDGKDRVLLAQRIFNGKIMTNFGNYANMTGATAQYLMNGNVGIGTTGPATKLEVKGNIRNSAPSQGYLELSGDLPGYATSVYPTLKTNFLHMYISVGGSYSAYITAAGVYTAVSDRAKKENFVEIDPQLILTKIDKLPMCQWNFKNEDPSIKHIAPVAQDFHSLFGLNGPDDKKISHIDPSGVALVGVKALSGRLKLLEKKLDEKETWIKDIGAENEILRKEIKLLRADFDQYKKRHK